MSDRRRAFELMDEFRTILRSGDAEPQQMVAALEKMVAGIERLDVDDDVRSMASGLVEETSMRVELIMNSQQAQVDLEEQRRKLEASMQVIERFASGMLRRFKDGMDREELDAALRRRAEYRKKMEDLGLW